MPALTGIAGLVFGVFVPLLASVAVIVWLGAVASVTLSCFVPATSGVLAGSVAFASLDDSETESVTVLTRFQFASTALTVTVNAVPAVLAVGVPVLPVAVPAAAVSPGTRS